MSGTKVVQTQKAYSRPEELTNFITYAFAAVLSFVGLVFLLYFSVQSKSADVAYFAVYTLICTVVFTAGALCHVLPLGTKSRLICKRFDRLAVCLLISGAFVPVLLAGLASGDRTDAVWAYSLIAVIGACVAASVVLNLVGVPAFKVYSLALYIIIGWACVIRMSRIVELCGWDMFWLLFSGGAVYLVGTILCAFEALPARHCVWHVFVLCGAALHFASIYSFIL